MTETTPEAAATRLERQISGRLKVCFAVGLVFWAVIEVIRSYHFPHVRAWTVRGWSIPFLAMVALAVIAASAALRSAAQSALGSVQPITHERLVLLFASGHEEGLRIVRGMAACAHVMAFIYGILTAALVAILATR